jgi:hypothetical protein
VPPETGAQGCQNDLSDSFWKGNSPKFAVTAFSRKFAKLQSYTERYAYSQG